MDWLILFAGLVVLLGGGEGLVRGATALSRRFGVSPFVIGMTVVAFGTSAPELAVNITAAIRGNSEITFGNVVGSNIANIGLILGLSAAVGALKIRPSIVTREIPVMLWATLITVLLGLLGGQVFSRIDGVLLLVGFVAFLAFTTRGALRGVKDPVLEEAESEAAHRPLMGWIPAVSLTVAGLTGVLLGSHWTVEGATSVAESFGVSQAVIGLTVVAVGTSLPELTASLFAAAKGHSDLAIGNVVGSNLFNMLFVLGASSVVRPVPVPEQGGRLDFVALATFSLVLLPLSRSQRSLSRTEGVALFVAYVAYMVWRVLA